MRPDCPEAVIARTGYRGLRAEALVFGATPPAVPAARGHFSCRSRTLANLTENVKSMGIDEATQDQVVLGRALRELRDRAELRQDELGARLGIDATYISQVENGRRGVRWHTVMRFLRALNASLADLTSVIENEDTDQPEAR